MKRQVRIFTALALAALFAAHSWAVMGERAYRQEGMELAWRALFTNVVAYTVSALKDSYAGLTDLIMLNPPVDNQLLSGGMKAVVGILQPLYMLAILSTALYLMFMSASPAGRAKAKSLLIALLLSMVALSLSAQIIKLLYQVSSGLTQAILNRDPIAPQNMLLDSIDRIMLFFAGGAIVSLEGGQTLLFIVFLLTSAIYVFFSLRYLVLIALTFIFPLSIFLYTFGMTRNVGRAILEQTIIWTFMQPVVAAFFMAAGLGMYFLNLHKDLSMVATLVIVSLIIILPFSSLFIRRFLP